MEKLFFLLVFLYIWLDCLGSLFERITSASRCIRYKRYTRHKYFHRGNHKGENPTNFFKIVRWSKAVIRSIQQLSISPPLSLSLSHVNLRVWGVYKWGRTPPYLYPFKSLTKHKLVAHVFPNMVDFFQRDSKYTLHDVTLGTIAPTYKIGCTSRSIHN